MPSPALNPYCPTALSYLTSPLPDRQRAGCYPWQCWWWGLAPVAPRQPMYQLPVEFFQQSILVGTLTRTVLGDTLQTVDLVDVDPLVTHRLAWSGNYGPQRYARRPHRRRSHCPGHLRS